MSSYKILQSKFVATAISMGKDAIIKVVALVQRL